MAILEQLFSVLSSALEASARFIARHAAAAARTACDFGADVITELKRW